MKRYDVRYIHKVATSNSDIGDPVTLSINDLSDHKTLGAALRKQGTMCSGARVREWRVEQNGRIVVFPTLPGMTTYWHSIILTPTDENKS